MSIFSGCCNPFTICLKSGGRDDEREHDSLLWHKGLTQCTNGDFSIAVVQANDVLEDQSQVKVGRYGTLIGIYDGHGGTEASRFVANSLFPKIEGFAQDLGGMSSKVLKRALSTIEEEFVGIVEKNWRSNPKIASVGTCCIVGVISGNHLYVASLGDSRVVLGTEKQGKVVAVRISEEHNAGNEEVRQELKEQHPDDSHIVVHKHGAWRVKGIIQVSRSIGDVYLKKPQLNKDLFFSHGGVAISFKKPVLSAEPSLHEKVLTVKDRFLIFASDGLWEQVTEQEAVDIVQKGSRDGIAKRLIGVALQQVAKKREMRYSDLKKIEPGVQNPIKSWPACCTSLRVLKSKASLYNRRYFQLSRVDAIKVTVSLFIDEDIGAEHGEGFETFRPRGPLQVDVDYLNDRMREKGLQRIRYAMKPDEAFGLIYSWDNVLADTRALRLDAWKQLASEEGKLWRDDQEFHRHILSMGTENAVKKVLFWVSSNDSTERLKARLAKIYYEKLNKIRSPREGVKEWLDALQTAGVPCAVASSLDRFNLLAALQRMGLYKYFQAVITHEDGMNSMAHRFLSAAVKLDRPPSKCVVFEDDPRGIAAAHNCSMKAVALIGSHPAYELTQADLAVSSFNELSVINLRRLFANKGVEFMDLQKQVEEKKPPKRRIITDTIS